MVGCMLYCGAQAKQQAEEITLINVLLELCTSQAFFLAIFRMKSNNIFAAVTV
jgi:hypothetical protein